MSVKMKKNITFNLKPTTFWDCNLEQLDFKEDKYFIISRIAERGTDSEVLFILNNYSKKDIRHAVTKSKEITPITLNYYENIIL